MTPSNRVKTSPFYPARWQPTGSRTKTRRPLSGICGSAPEEKPRIVMVQTRKGKTVGLLRTGGVEPKDSLNEARKEKEHNKRMNQRRRTQKRQRRQARNLRTGSVPG